MKWTGTRPITAYSGSAQTGSFVVSLAQILAQLRIGSSSEDGYLVDLIDAATEAAEQALDSSLLTRTIAATYYDSKPLNLFSYDGRRGKLFLPRGPVQSITSIVDANDVSITNYTLGGDGVSDWVFIQQTFTAPIVVTFVAGYSADMSLVPADLRMAIRSHVASLWRVRESISEDRLVPVPQSLASFYNLKKRSVPAG